MMIETEREKEVIKLKTNKIMIIWNLYIWKKKYIESDEW